jgi:hypothetical protein
MSQSKDYMRFDVVTPRTKLGLTKPFRILVAYLSSMINQIQPTKFGQFVRSLLIEILQFKIRSVPIN